MGHFRQQKLCIKVLLVMETTRHQIGACIQIESVHWLPRENTNFARKPRNSSICFFPGDSRSWESPEKPDNVWRLFIQILLRIIPDFSPGM